MCVKWERTNGPVNAAECADFAVKVAQLADSTLDIFAGDMATPFACSSFKSIPTAQITPLERPFMEVCGDFKLEATAKKYGDFLADSGQLAMIFDGTTAFGTIVVPDGLGGLRCLSSTLSFFTTDTSGVVCASATVVAECFITKNEFPYCTCEPGVTTKTPYSVDYSRTYKRSGNNVYCFKISVDSAQCGQARCCDMALDKIEWMSDKDTCLGAVDSWTISTSPNAFRAPTWSREIDNVIDPGSNTTVGVLKTNNLNLSPDTADGVEVCIALKASSKCSTMEAFCFGDACNYAVFDRAGSGSCCAEDWAAGNFGAYNRRR